MIECKECGTLHLQSQPCPNQEQAEKKELIGKERREVFLEGEVGPRVLWGILQELKFLAPAMSDSDLVLTEYAKRLVLSMGPENVLPIISREIKE